MSHEAWIMIFAFAAANIVAMVSGLIHITTKLTRIETDLRWIKGNCPSCRQTLANPTK
jgi:hypothetical protein